MNATREKEKLQRVNSVKENNSFYRLIYKKLGQKISFLVKCLHLGLFRVIYDYEKL